MRELRKIMFKDNDLARLVNKHIASLAAEYGVCEDEIIFDYNKYPEFRVIVLDRINSKLNDLMSNKKAEDFHSKIDNKINREIACITTSISNYQITLETQ